MIAVTGANGLLGSFIVRKLLEQREEFIALKRTDSDTTLLEDVNDRIEWRDADILDTLALDEALSGATHVIHAAAMVSFNPRAAAALHRINVIGTRNVVNTCLTHKVKKLIHISSVSALGRLKDTKLIDEHQKWSESALNSTYGETKYLAELEVFRGQEEGLNITILNPSVILAPADWTRSSAKLFKYVWDEKPFYVDSHINYVDVRDVAEAAHKLLRAEFPGERFIINAGVMPLNEFLRRTAVRFSKKSPWIKVNRPILKLIAFVEAIRARLIGVEPLITRETARIADSEFLYDNEKIKTRLKFNFQSIDETLEWCCKYYLTRTALKKMK